MKAPQDRTLDETVFLLRSKLADTQLPQWERGFILSILKHHKRPDWVPTRKQQDVIQRMIDDSFCPDLIDES